MNKIRILFIFTIPALLLFACSSAMEVKREKRLPFFRFADATLSKGIDVKGTTATPLNPATVFSQEDPEVVAYLSLENLSGEHRLRWEWYDPNGNLYLSSGDYTIKASEGKYTRKIAAWHRLSVSGEKAANYPGDWKVNIYLDERPLKSIGFKIEIRSDVDTLPEATQKPNPKNWGLVIGIENYANLPSVDYAKKDALIIKEYFIRILGVPEENIIFLLDNKATKSTIKGYIKNYIPMNVEEDTTLYVYFAGHGLPYKKKEEEGEPKPYLVPYDSDVKTIDETGYKLESFYEDIDALNIKRSFVFIDACFSGIAARSGKTLVAGARPIIIEKPPAISDKVISLSASSGGQMSNSYPQKGHGLFSYFLLRGLRGEADANENGSIDMEELYNYVKDNVKRISRRKGMEQIPQILPSIDMVKDIEIGRGLE